ncbi:MAG TPA: hypothetical protein VGI99_03315, partial [Gemmataceae bacterium]
DEGMAISRSLGEHSIDVQRGMRSIHKQVWAANVGVTEKSKQATLHAGDGIHLNDMGQLAMAFAILEGLGAPADVSSMTVDAKEPKLVNAKGCKVTELTSADGVLEFTRLDEGLPFNYGTFFSLNYRFIPVPDKLNRYMLTVTNLPKDRYEVVAGGRNAGTFTAEQLAKGVNIASTTPDVWQPGGPWAAQGDMLKYLTDARHEIVTAKNLTSAYLPTAPATTPFKDQANAADNQIVAMQRTMARPQPYHFVIKRHQPAEKKASE